MKAYKTAAEAISPPGDTIRDAIEALGMSQSEFAKRMGRPEEKMSALINGNLPIHADTAFRLSLVLGVPASFWMNREAEYRRRLHEVEVQQVAEQTVSWVRTFPIKPLKERGWLPEGTENPTLLSELLSFFSVANPEALDVLYAPAVISAQYRRSSKSKWSNPSLLAWLRLGEHAARQLHLSVFDKVLFREALNYARDIARDAHLQRFSALQIRCAQAGVALVFVKGIPNVPVSGVARWVTRQMPVIQLSDRFKTHDHFWFTFFHEAAHLLLHNKTKVFLEDENRSPKGSEDQKDAISVTEEKEANAFAANFLLSEENFAAIVANLDRNLTAIESFSEKYKVHPGIIVGRLQHEGRLPFSVGNQYKCKLTFEELAQQPGPFHR